MDHSKNLFLSSTNRLFKSNAPQAKCILEEVPLKLKDFDSIELFAGEYFIALHYRLEHHKIRELKSRLNSSCKKCHFMDITIRTWK